MTSIDPTDEPGPKPRRRHGLGADGIQALLAKQDGRCAICRKPDTGKPGTRLAVDHDHHHCSGRVGCPDCVRGLLCVQCNNLLRSARDDRRTLRAAIDYLDHPPARRSERATAPRPTTPRRTAEDMPVLELLHRLRPVGRSPGQPFADDDPRLLPRQGRRDRFFMMLLEAPAAAATVAEAGWTLDHDPDGYREAIRRADRFYGGPGAFDAHMTGVIPRTPDEPGGRAFFHHVSIERAKLGMSTPGAPAAQVTLGDVNRYLRSRARDQAAGA